MMAITQIGTAWQVTEPAWGDAPERVIGVFPTEHAADAFVRLMEMMSDISETCYAAVWMSGLEYALWEAVIYGGIEYGFGTLTDEDVMELRRLSRACDGWCVFGDDGEVYVPFDAWRERYAREHPEPQYVGFSDAQLRRIEAGRDSEEIPGLIAAYRNARAGWKRMNGARLDAELERGKMHRRTVQLETLLAAHTITVNHGDPAYADVVRALDRLLNASNVVSSREQMNARDQARDVLYRLRQSGGS